jgi:hypothetical protein
MIRRTKMDKSITVEKFWNAIKFSNWNKDGTVSISKERVEQIDKLFKVDGK